MSERIGIDEWMAELQRISSMRAVGLSRAEWAEQLRVSETTAMKRLRLAKANGLLVVGFRDGESVEGKRYREPVYSIRLPA